MIKNSNKKNNSIKDVKDLELTLLNEYGEVDQNMKNK
jgi:hypothetical protein